MLTCIWRRCYEVRHLLTSVMGQNHDVSQIQSRFFTSMSRSSSYLDKYLTSKRLSWSIIWRQRDEVDKVLTCIWRRCYEVCHLLTSVYGPNDVVSQIQSRFLRQCHKVLLILTSICRPNDVVGELSDVNATKLAESWLVFDVDVTKFVLSWQVFVVQTT